MELRHGPLVLIAVTGLGMLLGVVITFLITRPAPRPKTTAGRVPASKQSRGRR